MKAIHRIPINADINNLVTIPVPLGSVHGLMLEGTGGPLFVYVVADDGPGTQDKTFLFAQALAGESAASTLLDTNDVSTATYLGYVNGLHAWML